MALYLHELKRSRLSVIIWTASISFMLAVCVFIFPEMKTQMAEMSDMFANMGSLSDAFGMDTMDMSDFLGYFALECGEMLGLGGGLFAAIAGICVLSKEESDGTADFLLTHPVSRNYVLVSKLASVVTQIIILNVCVVLVTVLSILCIGEEPDVKPLVLLFAAYLILQLEIGLISFGISAFFKKRAIGLGLGLTLLLYFTNLVSNITEEAELLRYVTPYAYADGSAILENEALDIRFLLIGAAVTAVVLIFAFVKYNKKDMA